MPTATPFNNLITFSRGSNATVTGSNGLIQWAPNNLLTFSEQIDNAAWSKNNGTVAANTTVAPDGTLTADKFVENTSNSSHFIIQSATTTANIHTFSVYAKAAGRTFVLLYHDQSNSGAVFNLSNGAITTPSGIPLATASVTDAGNGWYRCAITVTATAASNGFRAQLGDTATNYVYTGDGVSGILLWGAQLELGSAATTYNPTTVKNLLGFSEAFNDTAWTKVAASIVTGAQANPVNGLFNAQKFMEDTTNAQHIVRVNIALPTITNTPYGYAVYAKAAGRTQIRLTDNNVSGATFTLTGAGATSNLSSGVTAAINQLADGWYRCFITVAAATVNGRLALNLVSSDNITYTGDGNSGVYIYGAQLSDSASLDPYVPTPGAAPSSTAYYGPRFDYDPVTLAARGLLVEEARTNLLTYSAEFDNALWAKTGTSSITPNTAIAPDGLTAGDTFFCGSTAASALRRASLTVTAAAHTYTIFAKKGTANFAVIQLSDGGANFARQWFNLNTGVVGTAAAGGTMSVTSAAIQSFGNGWYRCAITATFPSTTGQVDNFVGTTDGGFGGDATSNILIWGAQLEAGAFATSYIPTIASTVTRSADVATITGSLFSQWYNQPEGAFIGEASFFGLGQNPSNGLLSASNNTFSESISVFRTGTANNISADIIDNSVTQASFVVAMGVQPVKAAITYALNNSNFALNGTAQTTDTSCTTPSPDRLFIGSIYSGGSFLTNGHIRSIRYVPVRAADFQLQQVTT